MRQSDCRPLCDRLAFPLPDYAEHVHDHSPSGRRIEAFADRHEGDVVLRAQIDQVREVADAARRAIELGDDDPFDGAGASAFDDRSDSRTFKALGALAGVPNDSDASQPIAAQYAAILAS